MGNPKRLIAELAVGLAILFLLWVFFYPFIGQNRGPIRVACLSNVKQLMTSVAIYESDVDDRLPPMYTFDGADKAQKFIDATFVYAKNTGIYLCSADKDSARDGMEGLPGKMSYVHSLALKGVIPNFDKGTRTLWMEKDVPSPATTVYLRDPIRGFGTSDAKGAEISTPSFLSPHGGGFIVGYLDCHAKYRKPINEFTEL